jgi:hypothetical protein
MGVGITFDTQVFLRDTAPKMSVNYPYRAVICGEEYIVKGWRNGNLLTDKGEFIFRRLRRQTG